MIDPGVVGNRLVLIVDDEEGAREALREVVEMVGCSAIVATNGAEALELVAEHRPCLMILDLVMPVMTGVQVIEALRKDPALGGLSIVVSTSAPGRAPPGVPVLAKPIDIAALWACLRRSCSCTANTFGI
ncbi:MAG: response regulator [Polyangiaceae bacterium]